MTRRPSSVIPMPAPAAPSAPPPLGRLAFRLDEVAATLGVSRRTLERERSAGRFPQPDLHVGKCPLWAPATIARYVTEGGAR